MTFDLWFEFFLNMTKLVILVSEGFINYIKKIIHPKKLLPVGIRLNFLKITRMRNIYQ